METIHERIARLRNGLGLSMVDLAARIGVSWQTVQQWENRKTAPQRRRIQKVADALGVTPLYLQSGDDRPIELTPIEVARAFESGSPGKKEALTLLAKLPNAEAEAVLPLLKSILTKYE